MKTFRGKISFLVLISGSLILTASWIGWQYGGQTMWGLLAGGGIALLVVTAACYFMLASLQEDLKRILYSTEQAIKGDLTAAIEEKNYGWGELNLIFNSIRRILKGVHKWFSLVKDTSVTLD
ncbi:MAG TPA: hypothetical protein VFD15_02080, partial [Clostridia bacterium]|nr:hypothetical protein [Clostridia bacterium]